MSILSRAAGHVARALQSPSSNAASSRVVHSRGLAGHAHHGDPSEYITYAGLTLKKAPTWEYVLSKAVGATMWFWIFKMAYDEWDHKTKGLPAIFEQEGLDDGDAHGHGH